MRKPFTKIFLPIALCVCAVTVGGVAASWTYPTGTAEKGQEPVNLATNAFKYGLIYLSNTKLVGGDYVGASFTKTSDLEGAADIQLNGNAASTAQFEVTVYNNTNVSYYYDDTVTLTSNNANIVCSVSGIRQKDEVKAKSYATLILEFGYVDGSNLSNTEFTGNLQFKFAIDPSDIGDVVAESAVEKFEEVLNEEVVDGQGNTPYDNLTEAMDGRGDEAWQISYIGNVAGAGSGDSQTINDLFGEEFMSMDLDGNGEPEPITMIVKRENVDGNLATGDSYSYQENGQTKTESGVEMTLYITAQDFSELPWYGGNVEVWAVVYTKNADTGKWEVIVPLTRGSARANNYDGGWGGMNSFNTDTWESTDGKTVKELAQDL